MPIFKKKRKKVEIPEAPNNNFPEVEEMKKAIRFTIPEGDFPEFPEMPEPPEIPKLEEVPKKMEDYERTKELRKQKAEKEKTTIKQKPLFIKIDRFKEILESVDMIEKKIIEVSGVIKRLKEIHDKEEGEMVHWEQEIQNIKERLKIIEENLSKIES